MKFARLRRFASLLSRLRVWGLCLACPAVALGCVPARAWLAPESEAAEVRAQKGEAPPVPQGAKPEQKPEEKPADKPTTVEQCTAPPTAAPPRPVKQKVLPIDLDTVLRLAEGQNAQVALARERLHEGEAEMALADLGWVPEIYAGIAYYRHEGGIQDERGPLIDSSTGALYPALDITARIDLRENMFQRINAERKLWQKQGELARITSEKLLEAANTYIDLLTARTSEAVLLRAAEYYGDLLKRAEDVFKTDKSAEVLVEGIRAQTTGHRRALEEVRQRGDAAAAKLAYLLGLPPDVQLTPADAILAPVSLADAGLPLEELMARALAGGPGVRELESLLALLQDAAAQASGPGRLLPSLELRAVEGPFGAGAGSNLDWENRFDLGVQARWNLSDAFTACERKRLAASQINQVQLTYQDLRGKLALGVEEARQTILSGKEQIRLTAEQIQHACKAYRLSSLRLTERVEGASAAEVLAAIRVLEAAHLSALNAVRAHNKAQVRLMVLLGGAPGAACGLAVAR